jgi:hypothetical protein
VPIGFANESGIIKKFGLLTRRHDAADELHVVWSRAANVMDEGDARVHGRATNLEIKDISINDCGMAA